jgi:HAD superfamily hydrolase (TIGR01509 family)
MFEAVIFDWDGTLADTRTMIVEAFQKVLSEVGCFVEDEFIERLIGIGPRNTFKEALRAKGISFDDAMLDDLVRKKIMMQLGMTGRISLLDGAMELLNSLRGRVRMALATMANRKVIDRLLLEKRLGGYFDVVVSVDEVVQPKPDPEIFLRCASRLMSSPEDSVVVEDSIFGVKAAKEAGMKCVAVATGSYSIEELEKGGADLVVASLTERGKILDFLFS